MTYEYIEFCKHIIGCEEKGLEWKIINAKDSDNWFLFDPTENRYSPKDKTQMIQSLGSMNWGQLIYSPFKYPLMTMKAIKAIVKMVR